MSDNWDSDDGKTQHYCQCDKPELNGDGGCALCGCWADPNKITDEQMITVIAEFDGLDKTSYDSGILPDYLNDLNAIHKVEMKIFHIDPYPKWAFALRNALKDLIGKPRLFEFTIARQRAKVCYSTILSIKLFNRRSE